MHGLNIHISRMHQDACKDCGNDFDTEIDHDEHICPLEIKCTRCSTIFGNFENFVVHWMDCKKTKKSQPSQPAASSKPSMLPTIQCSVCGVIYRKGDEEVHKKIGCTRKCLRCSKDVKMSHWPNHFCNCYRCKKCKLFNPPDDHWCKRCNLCGAQFTSMDVYNEHDNNGIGCSRFTITCLFCSKPIKMSKIHSHVRKCMSCPGCKTVFNDAEEKQNHYCYQCEACEEKFKVKADYDAHIKDCQCEYCKGKKNEEHDCQDHIEKRTQAELKRKIEELHQEAEKKRKVEIDEVLRQKIKDLHEKNPSLFHLLDLPTTATKEEITKAYRKKMVLLHPDKTSHLREMRRKYAEEKSKMINHKYGLYMKR